MKEIPPINRFHDVVVGKSERKASLRRSHFWARVLCLLALAGTCCREVEAGDVSGHITTNTVWSAAQSPYNVVGTLYVDAGIVLTIGSGVGSGKGSGSIRGSGSTISSTFNSILTDF